MEDAGGYMYRVPITADILALLVFVATFSNSEEPESQSYDIFTDVTCPLGRNQPPTLPLSHPTKPLLAVGLAFILVHSKNEQPAPTHFPSQGQLASEALVCALELFMNQFKDCFSQGKYLNPNKKMHGSFILFSYVCEDTC
jgi:hypothetical protein